MVSEENMQYIYDIPHYPYQNLEEADSSLQGRVGATLPRPSLSMAILTTLHPLFTGHLYVTCPSFSKGLMWTQRHLSTDANQPLISQHKNVFCWVISPIFLKLFFIGVRRFEDASSIFNPLQHTFIRVVIWHTWPYNIRDLIIIDTPFPTPTSGVKEIPRFLEVKL